jgi:hypothetical protein
MTRRVDRHSRRGAESSRRTDWRRPEPKAKQRKIVEAVWNELRPDAAPHGGADALRDEVTRRVAMYAESGLKESHRIADAVLNSFGRATG